MSDILREVDEMMRADRMNSLWQQHGKTILLGIGAIILGTALNSGWMAYKSHQAQIQTTAIIDAMKSDNPVSSLKDLTASLKGSGRAFAALDAASLALDSKNYGDAIAMYTIAQQDKSAAQDLRDIATLQKVSIMLDHSEDAKAEDLLAELKPLLANTKSAWRLRALLVSAMVKAHKSKDYQGALDDLAVLSADQTIPPSMASQVSALQDVYQSRLGK
ncbi:MAG: tetratricopeptide repeat protein [Alphaproteobacteria bacterium]|nr:tetratricopeptide repeat protein [Alphaproteobacteria bacterium]